MVHAVHPRTMMAMKVGGNLQLMPSLSLFFLSVIASVCKVASPPFTRTAGRAAAAARWRAVAPTPCGRSLGRPPGRRRRRRGERRRYVTVGGRRERRGGGMGGVEAPVAVTHDEGDREEEDEEEAGLRSSSPGFGR